MSKKPSKKPSNSPLEAQEDFWDLGDDDLDLESSDIESKKEAPKGQKTSKKADRSKKSSPKKKNEPKEKEEASTEEEDEDLDLPEEIETSGSSSTPEKTKTEPKLIRKKEGSSKRSKKETQPLSVIEKLSLLIVIACIIGALGWGISAFLNEAPQGEVIPFKEEYPAIGQHVTIASVETWWRKPVRTGEDADKGVVIEAELIPCARIKLSAGSSTTLRVTFRNGEKQLIGDTINLSVENGKFTRSDSDEIEIYSTDGFDSSSKINSYTNEDISPWSLSITEGGTGDESDPLVKARISAASSDK